MGNDPRRPSRYDPTLDPRSPLPDVGSGPVFGADLACLYRAGVLLLPDAAAVLVASALDLDACRDALPRLGYDSGSSAVFDLVKVLDTVQDAILRTGKHTGRAAEALVDIVDDYVRTDAEARDRFDTLTVPRLLPERAHVVPLVPPRPQETPRPVNPETEAMTA